MSFLKTGFTSAAQLAGGLFAMTPEPADAQVRFQIGGNNGYGYSSGYQSHAGHDHGRSGYRSNNYGYGSRYSGYLGGQRYNSGYGSSNNGFRRSSGHYDYHPTTVIPHNGHFHVQPGHYDYHRGGHYGH